MGRLYSVFTKVMFSTMILLIPSSCLLAQENGAQYSKNAIFVEGLGSGIFYSINYDHRFTPNISGRVGFTSWSLSGFFFDTKLSATAFPIIVNYLLGDGASHLELGIGIVPMNLSINGGEAFFGSDINGHATVVLGTADVGYRLQPNEGGIFVRFSFTPLFTFQKFQPWGGVSLGASF